MACIVTIRLPRHCSFGWPKISLQKYLLNIYQLHSVNLLLRDVSGKYPVTIKSQNAIRTNFDAADRRCEAYRDQLGHVLNVAAKHKIILEIQLSYQMQLMQKHHQPLGKNKNNRNYTSTHAWRTKYDLDMICIYFNMHPLFCFLPVLTLESREVTGNEERGRGSMTGNKSLWTDLKHKHGQCVYTVYI